MNRNHKATPAIGPALPRRLLLIPAVAAALIMFLSASCGTEAPYGCEETVAFSGDTCRLSGRYWLHRTDIVLRLNDRITVDAVGTINQGNGVYAKPAGSDPGTLGLYLRVGEDMAPRYIGERYYAAMGDTGTLCFLTPEDDGYGAAECNAGSYADNTGRFDVVVKVMRAVR